MVERLGDGLGDRQPSRGCSAIPNRCWPTSSARATAHLERAHGPDHQHRCLRRPRDRGIAAKLTSSPAALREAWYRYRVEDAKGEQAFAGLFGLNVGQTEVDRGASFIEGVVERAGERP